MDFVPASTMDTEKEIGGELHNKLLTCLKVIFIGISPSADKAVECKGARGKAEGLQVIWDGLVKQCQELREPSESSRKMFELENADASWRLCVTLLDALVELKKCVESLEVLPHIQEATSELLSLQAIYAIQKALDIITGLGLACNLPSGVGVKYDAQKEFGNMEHPVANIGSLSDYDKFIRMGYVIDQLNSLCTHSVFSSRILTHSLLHYLAANIHLCYAPVANPMKNTNSPLSMENYSNIIDIQFSLRDTFQLKIIRMIKKSDLVKSVFPLSSESAPTWYKRKCRQFAMDVFLTEGHGMMIVASGLSEIFTGNAVEKICLVLSNLIKDSIKTTERDPFERRNLTDTLSSQAYDMICTEEELYKKNSDFWMQLGVHCSLTIMGLDSGPSRDHIWNRVFSSLFKLNSGAADVLTCEYVEFCILVSDLILTYRGTNGLQTHIVLFKPVWNTLFKIFVCLDKYQNQPVKVLSIADKIDTVWRKLQNILSTYLEIAHCNGEPRLIDICLDFLISRAPHSKTWKGLPLTYEVDVSPDSDTDFQITQESFEGQIDFCENICEFAKHLYEGVLNRQGEKRSKTILSSLFAQLLSFEYENSAKEGNRNLSVNDEKELHKFVTATLLAEFETNEQIIEDCVNIEDGKNSITMVIITFRRLVTELEETETNQESYDFMGSLDYALHITLALTEPLMNKNESAASASTTPGYGWNDLDLLKPFLKKIMDSKYPGIAGTAVQEFAENIYIIIMTRGQGSSEDNTKKVTDLGSPYERCLKNISNPAPFVKGHGLLDLKKCIEKKDPETIGNLDKILPLLLAELKNDDSYVYLLSISALSALGITQHSVVIPILLKEYICTSGMKGSNISIGSASASANQNERIEGRLKVAQSITGILKGIGEVAQVYVKPVMNTCLTVLRDEESMIRASALSTLAELSALLKFSLATVVTEIWRAVEIVMRTDKDVVVRRAALYLVAESLKGLRPIVTTEYIMCVPDIGIHLRDIRRKLEFFRQTEKDQACFLLIQRCFEEVLDIGMKLLTPDTTLRKHIRVLH